MLQEVPKHLAIGPNHSPIGANYDPLVVDLYAQHLARVNDTRGVTASENIYDSKGSLLIEKDAPITAGTIDAIVNLKLLNPIEDSVAIEDEIDAAQLEQDFLAIMQQDDMLRSIHERYDLSALLHDQCLTYQSFPRLRQKITVLFECMPGAYSRSLYCAWWAMLIAREMRLPRQDINVVFLGSIAHNIGMLHISPNVIKKQTELTAEEWRQLQAHVVIGQKFLQRIPDLPIEVSLAVFEHHERCDGTGYPLGKVESELSLAGQIIGLADSVIAIYHNRFKPHGRGWRDVVPVIQMNHQAYFYRSCEILLTILRRSELPQAGVVSGDEVPDFIENLLLRRKQLQQRFALFERTLLSLGFTHGDRKLHALQNVFLHIATSINGSGIFLDSNEILLEQVKQQSTPSQREVEDAYLMLEEVTFHLLRLHRMMQIYVNSGVAKDKTIQQSLELSLIAFDEIDSDA